MAFSPFRIIERDHGDLGAARLPRTAFGGVADDHPQGLAGLKQRVGDDRLRSFQKLLRQRT
jgi:hypothetical protein